MVAPNSPKARAQLSAKPAARDRPGRHPASRSALRAGGAGLPRLALLTLLALLALRRLLPLLSLLVLLRLLALLLAVLHLLGQLLRFLLQPLLFSREPFEPPLGFLGGQLRSLAGQLLLFSGEVVLPTRQLADPVERGLPLGGLLPRLHVALLLVVGLLAHQLLIEQR